MSDCPEDQMHEDRGGVMKSSSSKVQEYKNNAIACVTSEKWSSCVPQRKVQHGFTPLHGGVNPHLTYTSACLSGSAPIAVSVPVCLTTLSLLSFCVLVSLFFFLSNSL